MDSQRVVIWCLFGILIAGAAAVFINGNEAAADVLVRYRDYIMALHIFGLVVGFGGAIFSDVMFMRFLKDKRISPSGASVLRTLSVFVWLGLTALLVTGLGLFLASPAVYLASPKFLIKMVIVGVIIVNGTILHLLILPRLESLVFGSPPLGGVNPFDRKYERIAFALGGVSIISWFMAFALGSANSIPMQFRTALLIYVLTILFVVIGSQIYERMIMKS